MTIKIDAGARILIDGQSTGLALRQVREGTIIYTPESVATGRSYKAHAMPYARYSAAHDAPNKPGESYDPAKTAGRAQLEADVRALLITI